MTPSDIAHSKPVRTAAQWANLIAFIVVILGLLLLGELALSQIIGISRAPEQSPNGAGQMLDHLLPWMISLAALLAAGGMAIWSFIRNHKPRAWALAGFAYALPFLALTLKF
jgi:hypothetical protein